MKKITQYVEYCFKYMLQAFTAANKYNVDWPTQTIHHTGHTNNRI